MEEMVVGKRVNKIYGVLRSKMSLLLVWAYIFIIS